MMAFIHKYQFFIGLAIVAIISLATALPLFHSGFFPIHDDAQIVRVAQMTKALQDGQFPVRWVADLGYGYGYPLFNFYSPFPYYVGSIVDILGATPLVATKIMIGVGLVSAGIFMYLLGNRFGGVWWGIVSATLYQYAPYHAVQTYVRGAIGELYAYALIPLITYGLYVVFTDKKQYKRGLLTAIIAFTALILSHNIISMIATIYGVFFLLVYVLYSRQKKVTIVGPIILFFMVSFGLSAFFWLPALAEKGYTSVSQLTTGGSDYHEHFLYIDQLWDSPWGFAGSAPGRADGMSFKIGKFHIFVALVGLVGIMGEIYKKKKHYTSVLSALFLLIFSIFMTLYYSVGVWDLSQSFLAFAQFPWRFLVGILFFLSLFAGGSTVLSKNQKIISAGTVILVSSIVFINIKYFTPQRYYDISQEEYQSAYYVKWQVSKISDEYLPSNFVRPASPYEIAKAPFDIGSGNIENQHSITTEHVAQITYDEDTLLVINIPSFPGWKATIDGLPTKLTDQNGRLSIVVPEGKHVVRFVFTNTPIRIIANSISVITLLVLSGTMIWRKKYLI